MKAAPTPDYLFNPADKPTLNLVDVPLVVATDGTVDGYGRLVDDPDSCEIEIMRRPVDENSGHEGSVTEGSF